MTSQLSFLRAGEPHGLAPKSGLNVQSCTPLCLCNSRISNHRQTHIRKIQTALLDGEFRGGSLAQTPTWVTGRETCILVPAAMRGVSYQQSYFKRNKRHLFPFAVSRERLEEASSVNSTSSFNGDDRSPSTNLPPENKRINGQLNALDAYFSKLQGKDQPKQISSPPLPEDPVVSGDSDKEQPLQGKLFAAVNAPTGASTIKESMQETAMRNELRSIEAYLEKLGQGPKVKQSSGSINPPESEHELEDMLKDIGPSLQMASLNELLDRDEELDSMGVSTNPSGSESYMVYVLVAINIAVYLFGLASPIDTAGMGSSTLPLLYGAKVNELILDGQWWRLITPMFLHSGFLHVALSSWALLFLGPQVENVYGSLAFCMIYFLGGLCGNILSFFYTPAATIGGTGPFFAILSSWIVYLLLNKKALGETSAEYGIRMTALMGVLVLCLSCLLPIDEWIHFGAIFPGVVFGALACPTVQVAMDANDTHAKNKEGAEGLYGIYESPAPLTITIIFIALTALCLGFFNFFAPFVAES